MKRKSMKTRGLALVLAAVMISSSLTGCGKKDSKTVTAMDKDHVYKAEYFELPEGIENVNQLMVNKDRIYMDSYNSKKGYAYQITSMDPEGTDWKVIYEQNVEEQTNVSTFAVNADGTLFLLKTEYIEDNSDPENIKYSNKNLLVQLDADGKELLSVELKVKDDFSANKMILDQEGNILFFCYETIEIFDKEGKAVTTIDTKGSYMDNAFVTEKGTVLISAYLDSSGEREIKEYLPQEKKLSEPMKLDDLDRTSLFAGVGYDLLIRDNTDLYGYNLETKEKTKLMNWIDSDVNASMVNSVVQLSDGRMVFASSNYMKQPMTTEMAILTKVAPEDVVEKTVLTLAAVSVDMRVSASVIDYNKKSDKIRITIKDYSVFNTDDDYMAGSNKLNTDIISGNVPDLLCVSDASSFQSFVSKGLFTDINELMKNDKDFDRSEYLENILDAFASDGKLYSLVPFFQVFSMVGKTSNVGEEMGWTMEDLNKLIASKPEGTKIFENMTQSQIMYFSNNLSIDSYIDWENGACDFNKQEFKDLLEFAKQFPKETAMDDGMMKEAVAVDGNYENQETLYKKDKVLLMENYLYGFDELHRLQKVTFGEDITFIGFPTANKKGSAISPGLQLAISSKSAAKDDAWEFAKTFLSEEYQDGVTWGWPTKLSSIEKKKQMEQKPQTYIDENGKEVEYEETYTENGKEKKLGRVTDEECAKVMKFIESLTQVMRYDEKVYEIMEEETGAYFSDQKSVEETAKLIQNRIQTYLSEIQ